MNEVVEDEIKIPSVIADTVRTLEKHGRLKRKKNSKIEWVGWRVPTPLQQLLNGKSKCSDEEELSKLIAETARKMEL